MEAATPVVEVHPEKRTKPPRYRLRCEVCQRVLPIGAGRMRSYCRSGRWPRCCQGEAMALEDAPEVTA